MARLLVAATTLATLVAVHGAARADAQTSEPMYACKIPPAGTKLTVSFQPNTALRDLAAWVTGFTCKNVIFSADVAKHATKVTVISPKAMTPRQAMQLFVDAVEATGLVVVQKPDSIIIKLGPKMPKGCPDVDETGLQLPRPTAEDPLATTDTTDLDAELAKGIKTVSGNEVRVLRSVIDKVLANPMAVAKGARVVPAVRNGKPDGFKLYAIRPGSLYARLGFTNGDTLQTINGFALDSADKALEVYTKLREAKFIEVEIVRRGLPVTLRIVIVDKL